ncbi:MAG: hypothetical protein AAB731_00180 [Patescibacteria group bacterium]
MTKEDFVLYLAGLERRLERLEREYLRARVETSAELWALQENCPDSHAGPPGEIIVCPTCHKKINIPSV